MKKLFYTILPLLIIYFLSGSVWAQATSWGIARQAVTLSQEGGLLLSFLKQSNAQNIPPEFVLQVLENANYLQQKDLPPQSYLLKVNEGLAKGINPAQMQKALRRNFIQLEEAGRLSDETIARGLALTPEARRGLIQQYQWALLKGIPLEELQNFSSEFFSQSTNKNDWKAFQQKIHDLTKIPSKKEVKPKKHLKENHHRNPKLNFKSHKIKSKDQTQSSQLKAKHKKHTVRSKMKKSGRPDANGKDKRSNAHQKRNRP